MSERFAWTAGLVEQLTELANPKNPDRAVMAHLRRGIDRPPDFTLARVGWLFAPIPDFQVDDAILAAGLFAWVKGECSDEADVNFGTAFGAGLSDEDKTKREKRFIDLLDTDYKELPYKLRQAITLIKGKPIDWSLLIEHIRGWSHPDRWVQKQWARGFWSYAKPEAEETKTATT